MEMPLVLFGTKNNVQSSQKDCGRRALFVRETFGEGQKILYLATITLRLIHS
jgi:hypothetical protein